MTRYEDLMEHYNHGIELIQRMARKPSMAFFCNGFVADTICSYKTMAENLTLAEACELVEEN